MCDTKNPIGKKLSCFIYAKALNELFPTNAVKSKYMIKVGVCLLFTTLFTYVLKSHIFRLHNFKFKHDGIMTNIKYH